MGAIADCGEPKIFVRGKPLQETKRLHARRRAENDDA
jgi:hypothetical protein